MPKKKTKVKSVKAVKKQSSFFQTHKHLKWLLPLLLLVIVGALFVVKHTLSEQNIVERAAIPLHLGQEKLTPTVTPVDTGF